MYYDFNGELQVQKAFKQKEDRVRMNFNINDLKVEKKKEDV